MIVSFHLCKLIFKEIEDVVHAGPIISVENQVDPALSIVTSTQKCAHCHTAKTDNNFVCNDPGCETVVSNANLLRCDSPRCYLVVSSLF